MFQLQHGAGSRAARKRLRGAAPATLTVPPAVPATPGAGRDVSGWSPQAEPSPRQMQEGRWRAPSQGRPHMTIMGWGARINSTLNIVSVKIDPLPKAGSFPVSRGECGRVFLHHTEGASFPQLSQSSLVLRGRGVRQSGCWKDWASGGPHRWKIPLGDREPDLPSQPPAQHGSVLSHAHLLCRRYCVYHFPVK